VNKKKFSLILLTLVTLKRIERGRIMEARLGLERLRLHARKMALEMRMPATTSFSSFLMCFRFQAYFRFSSV